MKFNTLPEWLSWQESLHSKEIDLGLSRVTKVLEQLKLSADFVCPLISVAGTNGKGSTVAILESILLAANHSVLCYTSPHLFVYNERIRINGQMVSEQSLCEVFELINQARADISLSYFEFGTLAAICLAAQQQVDVLILEVGLGGRLDAVNILNADVSIVTTVDIDHCDWLGDTIEEIAFEKAGIYRTAKTAIYAGLSAPASLLEHAARIQADLKVAAKDYLFQGIGGNKWRLMTVNSVFDDLPLPALSGAYQMQNAAAAIMALDALPALSINIDVIRQGLQNVNLAGRFQCIQQQPDVYLDVAHNTQAAQALAQLLDDENCTGRTHLVIAMLADKAIEAVVKALQPQVEQWYCAGLDVPRGLSADLMAKAVNEVATDDTICTSETVAQACYMAQQSAAENDRIIIVGSFHTVAQGSRFFTHMS